MLKRVCIAVAPFKRRGFCRESGISNASINGDPVRDGGRAASLSFVRYF
jgi:hypothetical protein